MPVLGETASFIEKKCIYRSTNNKIYKNMHGKRVEWMVDMRSAVLDSRVLQDISAQFWDMFEDLDFQMAGIEMAGVPMVSAFVLEAGKRGKDTSALIVRIKRKKHMGGKIIEGEPNGKPILLIDDSINSGKNAELARKKLEAEGHKVVGLFCLVDFRSTAGINWRVRNKIEVTTLFDLNSFNLQTSNFHAPIAEYETIWSFASPKPKLDFAVAKSTPVIFEDRLIFGSDSGIVWGVEKNTGRIEWQFQTKDITGKGVVSSPVVHNGKVYFGAYDGILYCLDAKTGKKIYSHKYCNWIGSSPVIHNDKLYIGMEYNILGKRVLYLV